MKRMGQKILNKKRRSAIITFFIWAAIAIFIVSIPAIFPMTPYEELNESNIVIEKAQKMVGRRGTTYFIITKEGQSFAIRGEIQCENIEPFLRPNTKAKIKWISTSFLVPDDVIEELIIGGKKLVAFDNDEATYQEGFTFIGEGIIVIALVVLCYRLWWIKHLERLERKRNHRISKKYGDKSKENNSLNNNYKRPQIYFDRRGFDENKIHLNGTKYDDKGYDFYGFDKYGFCKEGYNKKGKNKKGQYNRLYDIDAFKNDDYSVEGFLNPRYYPVVLTDHAIERMQERLGIFDEHKMQLLAQDAYKYGKSARQIKNTSVPLVRAIENKEDNSIVLIYKNFIYIFTCENVLKTLYRNDHIPL